jgi:hypothetical protein
MTHHEEKPLSFVEQWVLLAVMEAGGEITIQGLQALCKAPSRRSLQRALQSLVAKKKLRSIGATHQLRYHLGGDTV